VSRRASTPDCGVTDIQRMLTECYGTTHGRAPQIASCNKLTSVSPTCSRNKPETPAYLGNAGPLARIHSVRTSSSSSTNREPGHQSGRTPVTGPFDYWVSLASRGEVKIRESVTVTRFDPSLATVTHPVSLQSSQGLAASSSRHKPDINGQP